jgi:hypothetical protein
MGTAAASAAMAIVIFALRGSAATSRPHRSIQPLGIIDPLRPAVSL